MQSSSSSYSKSILCLLNVRSYITECSIIVVFYSVQLYDVKAIILEQNLLSMAYDHHKINDNNSNF